MKKTLILSVLILFLAVGSALAEEARMMRYPDIHGDKITFYYGSDIWVVNKDGGMARRLTSHNGREIHPKFSPDGKWIAFSGQYDGNWDVYIIPSEGGTPRRLTYHPGFDRVVDWHPDGRHIVFRSDRESHSPRFNRHFKVSIDGTNPELMPLPIAELGSFNSDGSKIAYNRTAREFRTWKRYRGGMAQDIYVYDFENNTQENITKNEATDAFPMWIGDTIYFISDRDGSDKYRRNLYGHDLISGETTKLTSHTDWDVGWPSHGDDAIVYELGGWLYTLDTATGENRKVSVTIYDDQRFTRPELKNVTANIQNMNISPSGKRATFESRGEIFTVPAEKGSIRNITDTPGVREREPNWSPNGKYIAYFADPEGEFQIFIRPADGSGEAKQITSGLKAYLQNLAWSPDSSKIGFSTHDSTYHYVDVESGEITKVYHDNNSGTANFVAANWSPDSKWLTYSKNDENSLRSVYLFNLEEGKEYRITSTLTDDTNPAFDAEGKHLFWVANREFNPGFSAYEFNYYFQNPGKVVVATLYEDMPNPFAPESDEAVVTEEKKEEEKAEGEDKKAKPEKEDGEAEEEKEEKTYDLGNIEDRMINLELPDDNYLGVLPAKAGIVIAKQGQGIELHLFDMKKQEAVPIIAGIQMATFSADGTAFLYRMGNNFGIAKVAPKQKPGTGKLNLSNMELMVDYHAEWEQMYWEAWRQFRDMFYDRNLHGVDWEAIGKRYAELLPHLTHREDLNFLLGELIGEMNTGHTYRGGGDMPSVRSVPTGVLAADFAAGEEGYYQISKIYEGQSWDPQRYSPLDMPGMDISEGDYLVAINGVEVKAPENPLKHLVGTVGEQVTLKISSNADGSDAREVVVTPVASDSIHRTITWIMENVERVNTLSEGKVGYIYVPDTAFGGMEWFNRLFYSQIDKEALLVDCRFNSGGFIPGFYLERLNRPLLSTWATPYTKGFRSPGTAHFGPKAVIANEWAGSGGDAFPYYFRQLGLGPIIGKRTWGGLVGLSGNIPLMDGGIVTVPDFAYVNIEGEWDIENIGVFPDIEVENDAPSLINGRDPQLEKGVEVLLETLKNLEKKPVPDMPSEYPIR